MAYQQAIDAILQSHHVDYQRDHFHSSLSNVCLTVFKTSSILIIIALLLIIVWSSRIQEVFLPLCLPTLRSLNQTSSLLTVKNYPHYCLLQLLYNRMQSQQAYTKK